MEETDIEYILKQVCEDLGIKIVESRYYVNESTWHDFETYEDMFRVLYVLLDRLNKLDTEFKITIHNGDVHAIELFLEC